ncbi:DUF642 domain-containing protein [Rheinheimera maricola]|uniref:DUF642 domain-containing protein n=1 Tax=Rheinheimera maricola TaxID=2793282 RepID=A0ABS7X7Y1_9GAMM|nr:DUF642 domain-containing protein [Rheinheimera maricola]MBZ9611641.1 DUF642 domain-containing protein [Rheinheimera maricola]
MSFTPVRRFMCATALMVASFSSHAGLIINGDFESHTLKAGSWSWMSSNLFEGWSGSNIEIWNGLNGVHAVSGNHFIELNAHGSNQGNWSIFQTFATDIGQQYQLSFFYRARNNSNEQFDVSLAGVNWLIDDHTTQGWSFASRSFVATDSNTTLRFTALNSGTMGNFLDAVQVSSLPSVQAVPEPASIAAFGLGLLALAGVSRKRRNSRSV